MQTDNPFQLSLETLIGTSPLLGHPLEDRAEIRHSQQENLLLPWQARSTIPLADTAQQALFCVAPLDVLVSESAGQKQFHIIELNGTGIGGLTNMSGTAVAAVLSGLAQMSLSQWSENALLLVASSGKEADNAPRLNRLIYEKILYAEALKRGFELRGGSASVLSMPQIIRDSQSIHTNRPTVVVGYIKDFLQHLTLEASGELSLMGRRVTGAVNDRFCLNIVSQFARQVDLGRFLTMNRCFLAGGDKGVAYDLLNEYLAQNANPRFPRQVAFDHADNREALITTVLDWVRQGRQPVIKPHATGLGHGIEFFLSGEEREDDIIKRIDGSIRATEEFYAVPGGAFPYTVCEFIDTCAIPHRDHPLFGHKYELRVVVYRDGLTLNAFPSIVKISSQAYDSAHPDRGSLINNITASAEKTKAAGINYMLPLSNGDTLNLLGLSAEDLAELCMVCTGYVRHILDRVLEHPERFWLPAGSGVERPSPIRIAA